MMNKKVIDKLNAKASALGTALSKYFFLPTQFDYRTCFTLPIRIVIIVFFVVLIVLAAPPVIDIIISHQDRIPVFLSVQIHKQVWLDYVEYVSFLLEIAIAFLIGGSIFAEWATNYYKAAVETYEKKIIEARENNLTELKEESEQLIKRHMEILSQMTAINFIASLCELWKTSMRFINLMYRDVGRVNSIFLMTKALVSFPGGLYGLLAFISFYTLCVLRVVSYYIDKL